MADQGTSVEFPKTLEQLREEQTKIDSLKKNGNVITEISPEYAAKLRGETTESSELIMRRASVMLARPQKEFPQVMTYEEARRIVWHICQEKSAVIGRQFQVDDNNKAVIQNLIKYFIADPSGEHDPAKGLLIFGAVGLGKTYLMSVMQTFVHAAKIEQRKFIIKVCADIVDEVEETGKDAPGITAVQKYFYGQDYCFDDLGQELAVLQRYGNTFSVMERILVKRYANFVNGKCITHITTNLTPEDIESTYGSRLADRCNEMFNFVFMDGKSRR